MDGEIDGAIGGGYGGIEVFAGVVGCAEGGFRVCLGGVCDGLAHAPGAASDEYGEHCGRMMGWGRAFGNGNFMEK